jgi:hypothetical protein
LGRDDSTTLGLDFDDSHFGSPGRPDFDFGSQSFLSFSIKSSGCLLRSDGFAVAGFVVPIAGT